MSLVRAITNVARQVARPAARLSSTSFQPCIATSASRSIPSGTIGAVAAVATRSIHTSNLRAYQQEEGDDQWVYNLKQDVLTTSVGNSLAVVSYPFGVLNQIATAYPKLVFNVNSTPKIPIQIQTTPEALRALVTILKTNTLTQAHSLTDIIVTDRLEQTGRFSVKYLFTSFHYNQRFIVEVFARETTIIPSLAAPFALGQRIFAGAGWLEREAYDLYGIYFSEHGDLRRILTDYGFTGHPLRKDFPLTGFSEVVYNDAEGRVTPEPVELTQEFRVFHL